MRRIREFAPLHIPPLLPPSQVLFAVLLLCQVYVNGKQRLESYVSINYLMKGQGRLTGCLNRKSSPVGLLLTLVPSKGKVKKSNWPSSLQFLRILWIVLWLVCVAFGISVLVQLPPPLAPPPPCFKIIFFLVDRKQISLSLISSSCLMYFAHTNIHWLSRLICIEVLLGLLLVTFFN